MLHRSPFQDWLFTNKKKPGYVAVQIHQKLISAFLLIHPVALPDEV